MRKGEEGDTFVVRAPRSIYRDRRGVVAACNEHGAYVEVMDGKYRWFQWYELESSEPPQEKEEELRRL